MLNGDTSINIGYIFSTITVVELQLSPSHAELLTRNLDILKIYGWGESIH